MFPDWDTSPDERVCRLDVLGRHSCQPLLINYKSGCMFEDARQEEFDHNHNVNLDLCFRTVDSSHKWGTNRADF